MNSVGSHAPRISVAFVLLSVACSAEAGEERVAFAGLVQQVEEFASGVAERMAAVGRAVASVEAESRAEKQARVAELLKNAAAERETEPVVEGAEERKAEPIADAVEPATLAQGPAPVDTEMPPNDREVTQRARIDLARDGVANRADCMEYRSAARPLGFAYDHLVFLTNRCQKPMRCTVSTDVNPQPVVEEVAPGQTEVALTFRGSPARQFNARVDCRPVQTESR